MICIAKSRCEYWQRSRQIGKLAQGVHSGELSGVSVVSVIHARVTDTAYQMVSNNIVKGGSLVEILANDVESLEQSDFVLPWRPLRPVLLFDNPHARVYQRRIVELLWLVGDHVFYTIHRLQSGFKGLSVCAHLPRPRIILRLVPEKTVLSRIVKKWRLAEDGMD